jgi:hypothetical protein
VRPTGALAYPKKLERKKAREKCKLEGVAEYPRGGTGARASPPKAAWNVLETLYIHIESVAADNVQPLS